MAFSLIRYLGYRFIFIVLKHIDNEQKKIGTDFSKLQVSPGFLSKCGIVVTELKEFSWIAFLDNWSRRTLEDQQG